MSDDDEPQEWPLVVFTMAVQAACGLQLATVVTTLPADTTQAGPMRLCSGMVIPLLVVGLAASLFHLGRPGSAWRSLFNLGRSRLSAEILLTGIFAAAALAAFASSFVPSYAGLRTAFGSIAVVLGLVTVGSAALIYTVPTRPAWNSPWVLVSFYASALLLGGLVPGLLIGWTGPAGPPRPLVIMVVAGSALHAIAAFWMLLTASRTAARQIDALGNQGVPALRTSGQWAALGLSVVLGGVLPLVMVACCGLILPAPSAWLVVAGAIVGTALGRRLMYAVGTALPRF
jgi:anaerobic dimethyl sulfoxide reductase subunit C